MSMDPTRTAVGTWSGGRVMHFGEPVDDERMLALPGPANGYTLDVIECFERFGELIDWAMIILGPLEPWPGELVLDAAAARGVGVITRVVDYGGLLHDDVLPGQELAERDHRKFRP